MDGPFRGEITALEVANCFEVLHGDALVVLGAAGEDSAVGGAVGGEGRVEPFGGLGGNGVEVGVEEDGREGRVGAGPCEEEEGFSGDEVEGLVVDGDGLGLGFEVGDGGGVVWVWVGGVDSEIVLEAGDGVVFFLLLSLMLMFGMGKGCGGKKESDEEYE